MKISIWNRIKYPNISRQPSKKSKLEVVELKQFLEWQSNIRKNKDKGMDGLIYSYVSDEAYNFKSSDGVIFIDIDHINEYSDLIYDSFSTIINEIPSIVACYYSFSRSLHFIVYDKSLESITDMDERMKQYTYLENVYSFMLAKVISNIIGKDITGDLAVMDEHNSRIHQGFYICQSEYKYNEYALSSQISPDVIDKIAKLMHLKGKVTRNKKVVNEFRPSTLILPDDRIEVNKDFYILGYNGFEARTVIAAATYFHFRKDIYKASEYLYQHFSNANIIVYQMENMIKNGKIANRYDPKIERALFEAEDIVILKPDQYLSDVLDYHDLTENYYYIISNTNTGKTRFVTEWVNSTDNTILLQMNKALRDSKERLVNKTYGNHDLITDPTKCQTTIEGFLFSYNEMIRRGVDFSKYTIIVDESHLQEEYINIHGKLMAMSSFLRVLDTFGKVVFMTATPKSDMSLFNFKVLRFRKTQPVEVDIKLHYYKFTGNESRMAKKITFVLDNVRENVKSNEPAIIFSNRFGSEYRQYGIEDVSEVTYFNANNLSDSHMRSILDSDKMDTPVVLATNYLGVGIEIKGQDKPIDIIHLHMLQDEQFNLDFIIQSLGRPRDAKKIVLHFYCNEKGAISSNIKDEELDFLRTSMDNLFIETDNEIKLNILAAMATNIYDTSLSVGNSFDAIKKLRIGSIVSRHNFATPNDLSLINETMYKKVSIERLPTVSIGDNGYARRSSNEDELEEHILGMMEYEVRGMFDKKDFTYDDILNVVPYNDKSRARKILESVRYLLKKGCNLRQWYEVCNGFRKAATLHKMAVRYSEELSGNIVNQKYDESEYMDNIVDEYEKMKTKIRNIFTDEFISSLSINNNKVNEFELIHGDLFENIINELEGIKEENEIQIFKCDNIKDISKKNNGSNTKQSISIVNLESGERVDFDTKGECMKFLGLGSQAFSRFLKGESKKNNEWIMYEA